MKHLFIVNPVAGGRDMTDSVTKQAEDALRSGGDEIEVYTTRRPMDASERIKTVANEYTDEIRIYACGGDGTLNECVNGAAGFRHVAVTHYPCGTGNDFIKTFGDGRFWKLDKLIGGTIRELDLISVNGRYSVNISSIGIDARIGLQVHNFTPILRGKVAYIVSAAVNIIRGINMDLRVKCGDYTGMGGYSLICACNGRFYGGAFNPMPDAEPDDGMIEFLLVRKMRRMEFITHVGAYAKGRYREMPEYITHLRGKSMEIESDTELAVNVDGELMCAKRLRFEIVPRGIRFIFPAEMRISGVT